MLALQSHPQTFTFGGAAAPEGALHRSVWTQQLAVRRASPCHCDRPRSTLHLHRVGVLRLDSSTMLAVSDYPLPEGSSRLTRVRFAKDHQFGVFNRGPIVVALDMCHRHVERLIATLLSSPRVQHRGEGCDSRLSAPLPSRTSRPFSPSFQERPPVERCTPQGGCTPSA